MAWSDFLEAAPGHGAFQPHIADAYEVTNILFSSGTTGEAAHAQNMNTEDVKEKAAELRHAA
jgi:acyl-coenzyme A synthetase/AMP-(fatty) acid ligase